MDSTGTELARVPLRARHSDSPSQVPIRPRASVGQDKPKNGKGRKGPNKGHFTKGADSRRHPAPGAAHRLPAAKTKDLKLTVLAAFDELGGKKFLVKLGKKDAKAFAGLLFKLIPQEVTGKNGSPLMGDVQLAQITNNLIALPTPDLRAFIAMMNKLGATLALPHATTEPALDAG